MSLEPPPDNSGPVNPIDQKDSLSGAEVSPPLEEPGKPISKTQVAVQGVEASVKVEGPEIQLPEGFYLVEAIRSRRVRKGRKQYLIKWLDYPEAEKTWEPLSNLQGVHDLIDDFEKSYKPERKCKQNDRPVDCNTPSKGQQRSTSPNNCRRLSIGVTDNHNQFTAPIVPFVGGEHNGDFISLIKGKQPMEVGSTSGQGIHADGLTDQVQLNENPSDDCCSESPSKEDSKESDQDERPKGAKKRKLGPVKKFIKDPNESEPVEQVDAAPLAIGDDNGNVNQVHIDEVNIDVVKITKTLKRFAAHESHTREPYSFFEAVRSNGEITVVGSDYLLRSNPKVLAEYLLQNPYND